jgi:hypothetical protein
MIKGRCVICGREVTTDTLDVYYYDGVFKCENHPGVEEWYEVCARESDIEALGHPIDWDRMKHVRTLPIRDNEDG